MKTLGTLHLIPVGLSTASIENWLATQAQQQAGQLRLYIAENAKTARAFLKQVPLANVLQDIEIHTLSAKVATSELMNWLKPLRDSIDIGLVSEAGCPAVADPGARVVAIAHEMGARVKPWVGPSSIILGLMASGLDGQRFTFHGYAPIKPEQRNKQIKQWEQLSARLSQTQILIETPYRNESMFQALCEVLLPNTRLCIAKDLTAATEWIRTQRISEWKRNPAPALNDAPTLFLFQA